MFLAQAIPFAQYMPYAVFGLVAAVVWLVIDFFNSNKPRTEERLDELKNPLASRRGDKTPTTKKQAAVTKVLAAATPLAKPLQPKTELEVGKLKGRLLQAGFRSDAAFSVFLGLKFVFLIVGAMIGGGSVLLSSTVSMQTWFN